MLVEFLFCLLKARHSYVDKLLHLHLIRPCVAHCKHSVALPSFNPSINPFNMGERFDYPAITSAALIIFFGGYAAGFVSGRHLLHWELDRKRQADEQRRKRDMAWKALRGKLKIIAYGTVGTVGLLAIARLFASSRSSLSDVAGRDNGVNVAVISSSIV